jgi:TPR repeat protein
VPRDQAQARFWMEKAARNGDEDARKWLSSH